MTSLSSTNAPSARTDLAIDARDIRLTLGDAARPVEILKGIDLAVREGETLALLGPSGSGKSSLMAVLSGLERASGGSIEVAGEQFATLDEDALATARRGKIGIVLQAFHLLPTMTARENVATPMELAGMDGARARAASELEAVGLGHRLDHYPTQLSGGEHEVVGRGSRLVRPSATWSAAYARTGDDGGDHDERRGRRMAASGGTIMFKITQDLFEQPAEAVSAAAAPPRRSTRSEMWRETLCGT